MKQEEICKMLELLRIYTCQNEDNRNKLIEVMQSINKEIKARGKE